MMTSDLYLTSTWVIPLLLAITMHEAAHGYAALRFGDDTALRAGRISVNPLRHVDLFGTIIIPGLLLLARAPFLFGYAKPVPVDFYRLNNPRRDMVWVAAAGPGANIAIAIAAALALHIAVWLPGASGLWITDNINNLFQFNVLLAVFNMLPLPPLDGGRVAVGLLPDRFARPLARIEPYGLFILIGAIFLLPFIGRQLGVNINIFHWLVGVPFRFLVDLIATLTGHG